LEFDWDSGRVKNKGGGGDGGYGGEVLMVVVKNMNDLTKSFCEPKAKIEKHSLYFLLLYIIFFMINDD